MAWHSLFPQDVRIPPSLRNMFKELSRDLGIEPPAHGFLESWAKQGVLLLNTVLSVEEAKRGRIRVSGGRKSQTRLSPMQAVKNHRPSSCFGEVTRKRRSR
jgi:uracil DNA glycosylase